ncbi:hypothetical protein DFH06DRAFT_1290035 [Mycena polygramma]|nr:hypothetical protein DFH06DRAFT_1290035 [Mycena polygramma]
MGLRHPQRDLIHRTRCVSCSASIMSENSLNVGDILAVVFDRGNLGTFHWAICVPLNSTVAAKYHVTDSKGEWEFELDEQGGIPLHDLMVSQKNTSSQKICAAVKIGTLDRRVVDREVLTPFLNTIEMAVPVVDKERERIFTCRVWFRQAIRELHETGFLECSDVDALEKECIRHGLGNTPEGDVYKEYAYYVSKHSE